MDLTNAHRIPLALGWFGQQHTSIESYPKMILHPWDQVSLPCFLGFPRCLAPLEVHMHHIFCVDTVHHAERSKTEGTRRNPRNTFSFFIFIILGGTLLIEKRLSTYLRSRSERHPKHSKAGALRRTCRKIRGASIRTEYVPVCLHTPLCRYLQASCSRNKTWPASDLAAEAELGETWLALPQVRPSQASSGSCVVRLPNTHRIVS